MLPLTVLSERTSSSAVSDDGRDAAILAPFIHGLSPLNRSYDSSFTVTMVQQPARLHKYNFVLLVVALLLLLFALLPALLLLRLHPCRACVHIRD